MPPTFPCPGGNLLRRVWNFGGIWRDTRSCFFHLNSVLILYEIVRRSYGVLSAFVASLAFTTFPMVVVWSRHVVLEPPAVFMLLLASWALLRYEEDPRRSRAGIWFLCVLACIFTKQTAVFVIPAHLAFLWIYQRERRKRLLVTSGVLFVIVVAYVWFWYRHSPYQFSAITEGTWLSRTSFRHFFYYPYILARAVGWWMLVLAGIGILICLARRPKKVDASFFYFLAGTFYLMMRLVDGKPSLRLSLDSHGRCFSP
ncbi:MAG: glycosyltransferase family 39 protein [Planctomycetota bacterium]